MRTLAFADRNRRELLRDPLTLFFGLGFPLILLYLLSAIQRNVPVPLFTVDRLVPGIAAFGLTFLALFSALLLSKDRTRSLMARLCASPMRPRNFILGYLLPLIPLALAQTIVCYLAAIPLGLSINIRTLLSILIQLPGALLYIAIGLLCGTLLSDKQVGGVCGALLTNVCAWLSGIWFDLDLLGETFRSIAELLPFSNAVTAARAALSGNYSAMLRPTLIVCAYASALLIASIALFRSRMKSGRM